MGGDRMELVDRVSPDAASNYSVLREGNVTRCSYTR